MSSPGASQAVLARSLALRAAIALVLMAGFYALAVAIAGGLLWLPYAEWRYAKRVDARLLVFAVVGAFLILQSIVPRRDAFVAPGPRLGAEGQPRLFTELAGRPAGLV